MQLRMHLKIAGASSLSIRMFGISGLVDWVVNGVRLRVLRVFFQDNYGRYSAGLKTYRR